MAGRDSPSLVSVIIPTYNRSQLLRLTVESVLAQTYPNIEIIVVDDGSTDETPEVMAQYAGHVTYIRQAHRGTGGRNTGIRAASGDYLNFLDHDDLMMPTKLERQVQVLDTRPEVGLVHCRYYHINEEGNLLGEVGLLPDGDVPDILKTLVCWDFIWSGAPLIRRQCLDQVGMFDEQFWCSDADMWLRIALAGYRFACIQEPLGAYRILPDSQMANVDKLEQGEFAILDRVFADPRLPDDVAATKDQAYGGMRLWIGWRYYAAGRWDDGQRNLTDALALCPDLLEHPERLLYHLYDDAMSVSVRDPVKFVAGVFDHLPPCAEVLQPHRAHLLSQVHTALALREYGRGHIAEAEQHLAQAEALDPAILDQPEAFADRLCHSAMQSTISDPPRYAETVFQNLPDSAQPLARVRSRVLSEVNIGCAFQDYSAGRRRQVVRRTLTAVRHRPTLFRNRGVVSILLKSLPGLLAIQQVTE